MAPPLPTPPSPDAPRPGRSPGPPRPGPDDTHDGLRLLRRYHEATLQYHERRLEVKLIIDGATGEIVLPADPGFASELGGRDVVLHLPEESTCHLQLAISARPIARPEAEEAVDRWQAYHGVGGASRGPRTWLRCHIDGGKIPNSPPPGEVYTGEALSVPNALRRAEPRLVKLVNAHRPELAVLCRRHARLEVADPLCVGVDPHGLDVRARFGIVRVEFDLEAGSAEQAEGVLQGLIAGAAGPSSG